MSANPWADLPLNSPFLLPCDQALVRKWNDRRDKNHKYFVHDEFLPEPFVGSKDAPVILLSSHPGCPSNLFRNHSDFQKKLRQNLLHEPLGYPFVFLEPGFAEHNPWWEPETKALRAIFGRELVGRSLLNVVYFPYVTPHFGHSSLCLPSQAHSFELVRKAVSRGAVIVLMYHTIERYWLAQVPGLKGYSKLLRVRNPQNPAISPGNLGDDFQTVVEAIRVFAATA
jgi:hypothetical protein